MNEEPNRGAIQTPGEAESVTLYGGPLDGSEYTLSAKNCAGWPLSRYVVFPLLRGVGVWAGLGQVRYERTAPGRLEYRPE